MPSARSRVIVARQVSGREWDSCTCGNVFDNRGRNLAGRHGIAQALEHLEVDEKAQRRDRAFGGAMGQEELSGCGRVDLVEFFECQGPFQPGIGGMLNGCHEKYSLPASSVYFHVLIAYPTPKIPYPH